VVVYLIILNYRDFFSSHSIANYSITIIYYELNITLAMNLCLLIIHLFSLY